MNQTVSRLENYEAIYNKYIKPIEKANYGKFAAVSFYGQVILSSKDVEVVKQGLNKFINKEK